MEIPQMVLDKLREEEIKLGIVFDRVWGLLPPTPERDTIMLHVLNAKKLLHDFREENNHGND
jgi:hypothetical protein